VLSILLVAVALRFILNPLHRVEKQAEAIVDKRYIIQKTLPKTKELKQVVHAMNVMVAKLKTVFEREAKAAERLQKMAFQDQVTGLSNRRHFEMTVDTLLDQNQDNEPGMMALIQIQGLKALNDQYGYLIGDHLMEDIAHLITQTLGPSKGLIARLNGTELVVITPRAQASKFESKLTLIAASIPDLLKRHKANQAPTFVSVAYCGYQPGDTRGELLSSLDFGISQAEAKGANQVVCHPLHSTSKQQTSVWFTLLEEALSHNRFLLFEQSSYDLEGRVHDQEILVRLKDKEGNIHSAGYFMPAVEKTAKTTEIDKLVVKLALNHLIHRTKPYPLAINLTESILLNTDLQIWLKEHIQLAPQKHLLAFELTEHWVSSKADATWTLMHQLKALGVRIGIDHFGSRFRNMRFLQALNPDYVKLDAAFSKGIEHDAQIRSYVESLCEMTASLDIEVMAMAVETKAQQQAFAELGVKLFQGYVYGAPSPLE